MFKSLFNRFLKRKDNIPESQNKTSNAPSVIDEEIVPSVQKDMTVNETQEKNNVICSKSIPDVNQEDFIFEINSDNPSNKPYQLPVKSKIVVTEENLLAYEDQDGEDFNIEDLPIDKVVGLEEVSIRLKNCIKRLAKNQLPVKTLGAYFANISEAERKFIQTPNMGRKTVCELTDLVKNWICNGMKAESKEDFSKLIGISINQYNSEYFSRIKFGYKSPDSIYSKYAKVSPKEKICKELDWVEFPGFLFKYNLSTRLRNSLENIANNEGRSLKSFGDYLANIQDATLYLLQERNIGKKTINELNGHIQDILVGLFLLCSYDKNRSNVFANTLLNEHELSLNDDDTDKIITGLRKLKDDSALSFPDNECRSNLENEFNIINDLIVDDRDPEEIVEDIFNSILSDTQKDVLRRRIGIDRARKQTLEEIAKGYSLTRERIRQIEKKAVRTCRVPAYFSVFKSYLDYKHDEIWEIVIGDRKFVSVNNLKVINETLAPVSGYIILCLKIVYQGVKGWLDVNFKPLSLGKIKIGWVQPDISEEKENELKKWLGHHHSKQNNSLKRRIKSIADAMNWPLSIEELNQKIPELSKNEIIDYFEKEHGGKIKNGHVIHMDRIPSSIRLIYILRDVKHALHLSEIRAKHNKMFGFDMTEHNIGCIIQRLEEALIVDRGTYDLYENLPFSAEMVDEIRDKIYSTIKEKGEYLSSKVIYKNIFGSDPQLGKLLTGYMVLGIAQDDSRFSIERGLMIGLCDEDFQKNFTSLNKTICKIVSDYGPVSIKDIQQRISSQRKVLDITIGMVLQSFPDIILLDRAEFDLTSRVIGDRTHIDELKHAIEIILLDGPQSIHSIVIRLNCLGLKYNKYIIKSFCRKTPRLNLSEQIVSLNKKSNMMLSYEEIFQNNYDSSLSVEMNRQRIANALNDKNICALIALDYRLSEKSMDFENNDCTEHSDEDDVLDDILKEFDF